MYTYPEYALVQKCLLQIEEKLDWGSSNQWHNDVFVELSQVIQHETKIALSTTTLKRVWGKVNYKNAPSISTLNTLAQFAGYDNWRDFKNRVSTKKPSWIARKISPNLGIIVPAAALLTIVFISLFSMIGVNNIPNTTDFSKVEFSCHPVSNNIPNSVVFDFNLEGIRSDSIYIQQFWDETKTIKINARQRQATGIYYYPGYYRAKLLIDGTIIKENDLFIKSNGWLATIDYEPIPKYIKNLDQLALPTSLLDEIKTSHEPLTSTFHYVNKFKAISGDNFRLNTKIKNVYNDKWAVCQSTSIIIIGTKSAHIIPIAITGCASNMGVMMSDVYLSGKEHDLSSLSMDISETSNLELEVADKQITVFSNDRELFSGSYNKSIGEIAGIRFRFLGAGEVQEVTLSNLDGTEVIIDKGL